MAAPTVLYIEDAVVSIHLIRGILKRAKLKDDSAPVRLISAMQGSLGLEMARARRPDLILLDLHLPDMPGDEVLAHLRAEPETRAIPVIIISADANPRQIERLKQAGATEYLTKPLDVKRLLEVLEGVVG